MALKESRGLYFEEFVVGEKVTSQSRTITETDVVLFAGLSGDFNEIHTSEAFSKGERFGKRIAHGLLGLSIASGLAFQMGFLVGTVEVFRAIEWEFTGAIFLGDTIRVVAEVAETKGMPRLKSGKVVFKVSVVNQDGQLVQRGMWTVLMKMMPAE